MDKSEKFVRLFPWRPGGPSGPCLDDLFRSEQAFRHWFQARRPLLVDRGLLIRLRNAWFADLPSLRAFVIEEGRQAALQAVRRDVVGSAEVEHER